MLNRFSRRSRCGILAGLVAGAAISLASPSLAQTGVPGCPCDWDANGQLNSDDFFGFLNDFFAGNADFNGDQVTNSDDFFTFLRCFFDACPPPEVFEVVTPGDAVTTGDTLRIVGRGFGDDPDDLCVVLMNGNKSVPLQAVAINTLPGPLRGGPVDPLQELFVQVGVFGPDMTQGTLGLGIGDGERLFFPPAFPNMNQLEPTWVWDRAGGQLVDTGLVFDLDPPPPPQPGPLQWMFGEVVDGRICLFLDPQRPWPENAKIRVQARAHDHTQGIGRDLTAFCIELQGQMTAFECAERICDTIRCAFITQGGPQVECFIDVLADGTIKITMQIVDGFIDWGNLDVCITNGGSGDPMEIFDVNTLQVTTGDRMQIFGQGFGFNPDDLCCVLMNGNQSLPMQVVTANDNFVEAVVGPIPPNFLGGQLMLAAGQGNVGRFVPAFGNIGQGAPNWIWDRVRPFGNATPPTQFVVNTTPPPPQWEHGFINAAGELCIFVSGDWFPNQKLSMIVRAHDHTQGIGHDGYFPCIILQGPGGNALDCAQTLCDTIRCAFFQQSNGIVIECQADPAPTPTEPNRAKITVRLPGGNIDWGNIDICGGQDGTVP